MPDLSATVVLVIFTCLVSYRAFKDEGLAQRLSHWPARELRYKEYYRWISSGFVHGNWLHLLINMFVFWHFGSIVEGRFVLFFGPWLGVLLYALTYLSIITLASLGTYYKKRGNIDYRSIGASGGVSGIVFIFILFYPWQMLYIYGIIPIPGIIAGLLYLGYSSYASRKSNSRWDHDGHLYGALFGILIMTLLRPTVLVEFVNKLVVNFPFG